MYEMPGSAFKSIIGTLMEVFPYVTIWYPTAHPAPLVLIVGSDKQQYVSPQHIENEMLKEGVHNSLSEIDIHNSVHVLSCYIGDQEDLQRIITGYSVNSDYLPFVEFSTDRKTPMNQIFSDFVVNVRGDSIYEHIDWSGFTKEEKDRWLQNYRLIYKASSCLFMSRCSAVNLEKLSHCIDGLRILPDHPALLRAKAEADELLYTDSVAMTESGDTDKALDLAGEMLRIDPQSAAAYCVTAHATQAGGDMEGAFAAAQRAVDIAPNDARARFHIGLVLSAMGRFGEAIAEYKQMLRLAEQSNKINDYKRAEMLEPIAALYAAAGRFDEAIATAQKARELALSSGHQQLAEHMRRRLLSLKAQRAAQQAR